MKNYLQHLGLILAVLLSLAAVLPALAQADAKSDGWKFYGEGYLWAAGIDGESAAGDDLDIPFKDILENLDGALMGGVSARKGDWGLFLDMIYLNVHEDTHSTANLIDVPTKISVDVELQGFIATFGGSYRIMEKSIICLDLLAGGRYLALDVNFDADIGPEKIKYSDSGNIWDGIIGLSGRTDLSKNLYLRYYADLGFGDSDRTFQLMGGIGYRLDKVDIVVGYRYLRWDFDNNDTFDTLNLSGPMLGIKFRF